MSNNTPNTPTNNNTPTPATDTPPKTPTATPTSKTNNKIANATPTKTPTATPNTENTATATTATPTKTSNTPTKSNTPPTNINSNGDMKTEEYKKKILDANINQTMGIYPIMLNISKIHALLKSKNIKVTPENSFRLMGEYVNRDKASGSSSFEEMLSENKKLFQLNNNFETIIETIQLFSGIGKITPRTFITTINNLLLHYKEENKDELLLHYAYLAEIVYQHFSLMMDNTEIERDEFFNNDSALDIPALQECAEFYYTDIYMLNSEEKEEYIKTLKSYYLTEKEKKENTAK
jgi:hypothetical protein